MSVSLLYMVIRNSAMTNIINNIITGGAYVKHAAIKHENTYYSSTYTRVYIQKTNRLNVFPSNNFISCYQGSIEAGKRSILTFKCLDDVISNTCC